MDKFWNEPDYHIDCAFGLPLYLQRNRMKAWCGYVGLPSTHPLHSKTYSHKLQRDPESVRVEKQSSIALFCQALANPEDGISLDVLFNVHGGLTFSGRPYWPESRADWFFGFDCSHAGDLSPSDQYRYPEYRSIGYETYRDLEYALREARELASQLSDFTSGHPETFR